MDISSKTAEFVAIFIIIVISIVIFIALQSNVSGSNGVKSVGCGMLYMIPMGSLVSVLTGGCAAIPA